MRGSDIAFDKLGETIERSLESIKLRSFQETMQSAKVKIHRNIRAGFNSSADPSTNENWKPRKRRYPHPILIKTGAMMQAATGGGAGAIQRVEPRRLTIGVNGETIFYARFHQTGVGALAARPFVGASDETLDSIGEEIADAGLSAFME